MGRIGAIILAAGGSSRLGEPKQFLRFEGETLVRRAARVALEAGASPVIVVAGDDHERVESELTGLDARVIHHGEWRRGMGSSIREGLEAALIFHPALDGVIVMVCDQPFVTVEILSALLTARSENHSAAAAKYAGTVGVPAFFSRPLFPKLLGLAAEYGAKRILAELGDAVARVPFPDGEIDIDTPSDLAKWSGKKA